MVDELNLFFLGTFQVLVDGVPVMSFESDKTRALLAYLAIESDRPHRRENLTGLFWPESSERNARKSLSQALYNLRQVICQDNDKGPLEMTPKEVFLPSQDRVQVDVVHFMKLTREVSSHTHPADWACRTCLENLTQAVDLFQGEFLAGLSLPDSADFEVWLREQREHLNTLAREGLKTLADSHLKRGNLDQAQEYSERLAALDPFNEENLRQLLTILARKGRREKAIGKFQAFQRMLMKELGIQPEDQTLALYKKIRDHPAQFKFQPAPGNLPVPRYPFVGRQSELDDLYWKLIDPGCQCVTILGMGGSGKTRLAMEAGRMLQPAFRDGVFWIDMSGVGSTQDILPVIFRILDFPPSLYQDDQRQAGLAKKLAEALRGKELLLILDGSEIVLDGVVLLVETIKQVPGVKVLVTSRMRLNLQEEILVILEGLPYPVNMDSGWEEYPAVQLFIQVSRRSQPDFSLSEGNATPVVEICQSVHGIPLAILLAAAWTSALSPGVILKEIRQNLDFLTVDWRDMPARQQSLRAVFDYSWKLLWEKEKLILRRIAIFHQPFSIEEAIEITQATIHELKALQDFSLVQRTGGERLRLHDLVRQYAQDKLNQEPQESLENHNRLSSFFLKKLKTWEKELKTSQQEDALTQIDLVIENVRLAWEWVVGRGELIDLENGLEALCIYYKKRGQAQSGENICALVIARLLEKGMDQDSLGLWARAASWQAHFWVLQGQAEPGLAQLENVLEELAKERYSSPDLTWEKALALFFKASGLLRWDNPTTLSCAIQSAEIFIQYSENWYAAKALGYASEAAESLNRHAEQVRLAEKALSLVDAGSEPELRRYVLYSLGLAYLYSGEQEKGTQFMLASHEISPHPIARNELLRVTRDKAVSYLWSGDFHKALPEVELLNSLHKELVTPLDGLECMMHVTVFWGLGRYAESLANFHPHPDLAYFSMVRVFKGTIHLLYQENEAACSEFESCLEGLALGTDTRFIPIALAYLSIACYRLGKIGQSRQALVRAFDECFKGNVVGTSICFQAVVYFLLELGEIEKACEFYPASLRLPAFGKSAWLHDFLGARLEKLSQALPAGVAEAARERGKQHESPALLAEWITRVDCLIPEKHQ